MKDYKAINKHAWNIKTPIHIKSEFYDNEAFLKGKNTLKSIELNLLGDIRGKSILHLQCHFGQDSISLARLGAKVTGIDLSDQAIDQAKELAELTKTSVNFICCDIYDLPNHLNKKYDVVFTSYGVIGWLPDLNKWAKIISHFLKPQGRFIIAEFHPIIWMFNDDFSEIAYDYFNTTEIIETMEGSYADRNAIAEYETISWNHSTSEVLNNLISEGIEITKFEEYDYSPYNCFKNTVKIEEDKYKIKHLKKAIPMVFAIEGIKKIM